MTDRAIRKWIAQGRLPATRYGGRWLIDQTDLDVRALAPKIANALALKNYQQSRGQITRIQSRLNQTIEDIRNNRSYSDSGRRAEMAKATFDARSGLNY